MYNAAVLTVSDKGYTGQREDLSGPLIMEMLREAGYNVLSLSIVPDEQVLIAAKLRELADTQDAAMLLTTGGTGFAPRDVTPEATLSVVDKVCPGIPEAMRAASMQVTDRAMLSRAVAGIRGKCLIINLPGSPKAVKENLEAVLPALGHGLDMLRGEQKDHT
ncbi:MAG: MogA/MoaB family molybdenum cofactor biosynthesis protein [Oscillospiraceae bacterium]|nr:MogA/MoaB family molybdenum cofactor biosynthesis protein [Oscillospiraceae bacterium]